MEMNGFMGGIYRICEWITRLAYVNVLWILFSLLGLVVLGFMPATVAMFAVTRKWVQGEVDVPVFKTFWESYKREFWKANLLGLMIAIATYILYADYQIFKYAEHSFIQILSFAFLPVVLLYFLTMLYIFPVFVHYDVKLWQHIKYSLFIAIGSPLSTLSMIVGLVAIYLILGAIPGLILFFSGSTVSFIFMAMAYRAFTKIQEKMEEHQNGDGEDADRKIDDRQQDDPDGERKLAGK